MGFEITIKSIHTAADHAAAIHEARALFGSAKGSSDADKLHILSLLISEYESRHCPVKEPDDPLASLRFWMEQKNISKKDLVGIIGASESYVGDILAGRRNISLNAALRFSRTYSVPIEHLLKKEPPVLKKIVLGNQIKRRRLVKYSAEKTL